MLSDDGSRLATVDDKAHVSVWDTASGRRVATFNGHVGHKAPYLLFVSIAWSRDGSLLLTGDTSGKAYLWRARDGHVLNTFSGPPQAPRSDNSVPGGAIAPGNRTVLFTDPWDAVGRLYTVGQPAPIGTLRGTSGGIRSARFNADGSLVVTTGDDGDRVWDVASRQPLLVQPDTASLAGFGAGGRTIVTAGPTVFHGQHYRQSFTCDVCGTVGQLIALARQRASRALTPAERAQYLHR